MSEQPTFDFDDEQVALSEVRAERRCDDGVSIEALPPAQWHEVPQERFLSWSPAMQDAYCKARDLDAAEREEDPWWLVFYYERARS